LAPFNRSKATIVPCNIAPFDGFSNYSFLLGKTLKGNCLLKLGENSLYPSEVSRVFNLNPKVLKLAIYPLKFQKVSI
jgi:hypothetical protein